jgi:hypothetical protein
VLAFYAPFENGRRVQVADNHAAAQGAAGVRRWLQEDSPPAKRITWVMDTLNTPTGASLYTAFPPAVARSWLDQLELVYPPRQGSWLNRAECEFSILSRPCLARRRPGIDPVTSEVQAGTKQRPQANQPVDWRFTTHDARIKVKRLYPKLSD